MVSQFLLDSSSSIITGVMLLCQYLLLHAHSLGAPSDNIMSCLCVLLPFAQVWKNGPFTNWCTEELGFDLWPSGYALSCSVCSKGSPPTVTGERGLRWIWGSIWPVRLLIQVLNWPHGYDILQMPASLSPVSLCLQWQCSRWPSSERCFQNTHSHPGSESLIHLPHCLSYPQMREVDKLFCLSGWVCTLPFIHLFLSFYFWEGNLHLWSTFFLLFDNPTISFPSEHRPPGCFFSLFLTFDLL